MAIVAGPVSGGRPPAVRAANRRAIRLRLLGRNPIGLAFVAPYVLFLGGLFAYPLLVALYISFYDYFFAAPGAVVSRPFVGFDNYVAVLGDPVFQRSILNVAEFILINVPLTVLLVARAGDRAQQQASRSGPSSGPPTTSRT